jgi:hypothetical protein
MRLLKCGIMGLGLLITGAHTQILPDPIIEDTLTVSGTVTEYSGMLPVWIPLAGARIILSVNLDIILNPNAPIVPREWPLDTAYADSNGHYEFKDVLVGSDLSLTASCKGYHDSTAIIPLRILSNPNIVANFALRKITGQERCVVRGRILEKQSGSVKNEVPLADALVTVTPNLIVPLGGAAIESYSDVTDDQGCYEIIAVVTTTSDFLMTVTKAGYQYSSQALKLAAGETVTVSDVFLEPQPTGISRPGPIPLSDLTLRLFPNPITSGMAIDIPHSYPGLEVSIHDLTGRPVFTAPARPGLVWQGHDQQGFEVPKGRYVVIVRDRSRIMYKKEIIYQ